MRSQGYHHSSPGLPEFTTVTRVPVLTGATVDEFAAIGAAVPARASPGPATPTAACEVKSDCAHGVTPEFRGKVGVLQHPHPSGCRSSTQSQRAWKALRELAGLDR